jgi:hypothetical protein
MTLFVTVVAASQRVAATSARSAKIRLLADCLRSLEIPELELAVLFTSQTSTACSTSSQVSAGLDRAHGEHWRCGHC